MRFILLFALVAVVHGLLVFALGPAVLSASGKSSVLLVPFLWSLTAPMQVVMSSTLGQSISPGPLQMLWCANSAIYGLLISSIFYWVRFRRE